MSTGHTALIEVGHPRALHSLELEIGLEESLLGQGRVRVRVSDSVSLKVAAFLNFGRPLGSSTAFYFHSLSINEF